MGERRRGRCHLRMAAALQGANRFGDLICRGAVICPACWCGRRWPLALMVSAGRVPFSLASTRLRQLHRLSRPLRPRSDRHPHLVPAMGQTMHSIS